MISFYTSHINSLMMAIV